jgi:three-Cys-motif partner protein
MADSTFFDESTEQSQVKAAIVTKYFLAWARVIIPFAKKRGSQIAYIDLFAGPGRYKDGTKSTPLLILEQAIANLDLRRMLVTIFNDVDSTNTHSLELAIKELPGIAKLKYRPKVYSGEVGEKIVAMFESMALVPTLFFVDPWGYKGLSLRLISSILKHWGCDCIFFFNYNRINAGLGNDAVREHMDALFGDRADELRGALEGLDSTARELTIVERLSIALNPGGTRFVLPFRFRQATERTSHHLIFVTKNFRGYDIMKKIMAKESSTTDQGVPSLEYSPADASTPLLFSLQRPLDGLANELALKFAGTTMSMIQIYDAHHVDTPFIKRNYKDALLALEAAKRIQVSSSKKRRAGTFADDLMATFPAKSGGA